MRIFITGGTGFIGKVLVKKLANTEHRLLVLSRKKSIPDLSKFKNVKLIRGDLSTVENLSKELSDFSPEVVIHLAWEGIPDYSSEMCINNLYKSLNLYQVISKLKCKKVICAGSLWEYGASKDKVTEKTQITPFNLFTATKNSLNILGREIFKEKGINFIWLRIFYVYGPGQRTGSLIPSVIDSIRNNRTPEVRNPDAKNDFIYVDDVADAIISFLNKDAESGEYNLGSGKLTSVREILRMISAALKSKLHFEKSEMKQQDKISYLSADITKIKNVTGWKPLYDFKTGMKQTIKSFM